MLTVHDHEGKAIGDIPISPRQQAMLEDGHTIVVQYHTPQLLRSLLGEVTGSFSLHKSGEHIRTIHSDQVCRYIELQRAIKKAQGED